MENKKQENVLPKLITAVQQFTNVQTLSGVVLFVCTAVALILANSSIADSFKQFWETEMGFDIGFYSVYHTLNEWINDGLMAVFFFVIGLETKREFLIGELSYKDKAWLPVMAAFGGAAIPALVYTAFTYGGEGINGWGIPMATDIAFVLGIIMILGKRVPESIKIFVLAFAIIDDLIAISVIAIFYTEQIHWMPLLLGAGTIMLALFLKQWVFYNTTIFLLIGTFTWFAFLESGIHPTIAGVLMALTVPVFRETTRSDYGKKAGALFSVYNSIAGDTKPEKEQKQLIINKIESLSAETKPALDKLLHALHPVSSFVIMPAFALANAGITFDSDFLNSLTHMVSLGIIAGLLIGKPVGIFLSMWLSVKFKIAVLPTGVNWKHVLSMACLGGMGFTLSLFISLMAFKGSSLVENAKIGVLMGSLFSIIAGVTLFMSTGKKDSSPENKKSS